MPNAEQDLVRWLRTQLIGRNRPQPIDRIVLRNASTGFKGAEVQEFTVPTDEELAPEQVSTLSDEIMVVAQQDADGAGTKLQNYLVMALSTGAKTGPRFRFRLRGEGEDEDSGEETPDARGLMSQLMRHQEVLMRMATFGAQQTIGLLAKQLVESQTQVAKLQADRLAQFQAVEDAKSLQHDRELQLLTAGGDEERKNALQAGLLKKFDTLFPIVMAKLAGKKSALSEAELSVLKPFVQGLTADQIQGMMSHLDNEQRIALLTIFKELQKSNN